MRLPHRALPTNTSMVTTCLLATSALTAGMLVASSAAAGGAVATGARGGSSPVVYRDAPGQDPKTLNGHGPFELRLSNTADGRILVSWTSKAKAKNLKKWKIVTSTSRILNTDTTVYYAKPKSRSLVVRRAPWVTPASGDYTFVKLFYRPKHHKSGGGSSVHWIQAPVTAVPSGAGRATIGTFNVRDAAIDQSGPDTWANRRQRVVNTILGSGAGVVDLQEASGMALIGGHWDLTQAHDISNGTGWRLASDAFFDGSKSASQGTRILYNPNRVTMVPGSEGHELITGDRFIEWAEFVDNTSGRKFWDISMHLYSGKNASYESIRVKEAQQVIAVARALNGRDGAQVFVAGDSNSTIYTAPKGMVHRTFIGAGFYDAFATRSIANQAYPTTNDFEFPVKPSPHRRDLILSFRGPQGSYWYKNLFYNSASQAASDHFMQVAQLPVR